MTPAEHPSSEYEKTSAGEVAEANETDVRKNADRK